MHKVNVNSSVRKTDIKHVCQLCHAIVWITCSAWQEFCQVTTLWAVKHGVKSLCTCEQLHTMFCLIQSEAMQRARARGRLSSGFFSKICACHHLPKISPETPQVVHCNIGQNECWLAYKTPFNRLAQGWSQTLCMGGVKSSNPLHPGM